MASRFLHYLIGDRVAKELEIKDYKRFMTGNLYPDCVSGPGGRGGQKGISHFVDNTSSGKWEQDVETAPNMFCKKYAEHLPDDELYLGYVCHLVADMVWHDEIYVRIKKKFEPVEFSVLSQPLYRDYHRLNEILRKEYGLTYQYLERIDCDIEEIELEHWEDFVRELEEDFKEDLGAKKEDLEILLYDWILKFLEDSMACCYEKVKEIMEK